MRGALDEEAREGHRELVGFLLNVAQAGDLRAQILVGFLDYLHKPVEHVARHFGKPDELLLPLKEREFAHLGNIAGKVFQALYGSAVFSVGFALENPACDPLYLRYEGYQQAYVAEIEKRMEHREPLRNGDFEEGGFARGPRQGIEIRYAHCRKRRGVGIGVEGDNPLYHSEEHIKYAQNPYYADNVEDEVRDGRPLCREIGSDCREVGSDGGAYVLAQNYGRGEIEVYPSFGRHGYGDGDRHARRLYHYGEQYAERKEEQHRQKAHVGIMAQPCERGRVWVHVRHGGFQKVEAHEQQAEADEELAGAPPPRAFAKRYRDSGADERQGERREFEFEPEGGDNPCGGGSPEICPHYDAYALAEGQKSGIHEAHYHNGGRRRRLYHRRHQGSGKHPLEPVARHGAHYRTQTLSRNFLKPLAHELHAEQEQPEAAEDLKYRSHIKQKFGFTFAQRPSLCKPKRK